MSSFIDSFPKRLSDKDRLALNMHVNQVMQEHKPNPILDNFCHRLGINLSDFVRIVVNGHWREVEKELKCRHII